MKYLGIILLLGVVILTIITISLNEKRDIIQQETAAIWDSVASLLDSINSDLIIIQSYVDSANIVLNELSDQSDSISYVDTFILALDELIIAMDSLDSLQSALTPSTTNDYNLGESYRIRPDTTLFDYEYYPIVIVIGGSRKYKITLEDIEKMTDEEFEKLIFLYILIFEYTHYYIDAEILFQRKCNKSSKDYFNSACKLLLPEWILKRQIEEK